ncbi:MAG: 50S ribosomal protein L37ae [Nanoarchaeota archaeon]
MTKTKKVRAAGRFGARYGRSVRTKIADIESIQRKKQQCPFCEKTAARIARGIWQCKKCGKKFTGHVYFLASEEKVKSIQTVNK